MEMIPVKKYTGKEIISFNSRNLTLSDVKLLIYFISRVTQMTLLCVKQQETSIMIQKARFKRKPKSFLLRKCGGNLCCVQKPK